MDKIEEVKIPCQCEAAKDGNCQAVLGFKRVGKLLRIQIEAPHINKEAYGGILGVYVDCDQICQLMDAECQEKIKEYVEAIEDARWCGYESGKNECQKQVKRILESITEDFVEPVANFYVSDVDRQRTCELWKSIKREALKKQEGA